jgi:hypothetical protein
MCTIKTNREKDNIYTHDKYFHLPKYITLCMTTIASTTCTRKKVYIDHDDHEESFRTRKCCGKTTDHVVYRVFRLWRPAFSQCTYIRRVFRE